ncbi:MAG: VWA domain-containing protein [Anaerolineae bacterium]
MNRRLPALKFAVSVAVAAVALTAVLAAPPAARPAAARRADPTATPPSATTRSGCRVETARGVDAARVGLTDTVAVTLSVRGCVPYRSPRHIALVIDNDLGDAGEARQAKSALFEVVDAFDLPRNPSTEVAVVGFGSAVQLLSALSNDDQRIRGAIRRAGGAAGDAVDRGIDAARRELQRGRRAAADRDLDRAGAHRVLERGVGER